MQINVYSSKGNKKEHSQTENSIVCFFQSDFMEDPYFRRDDCFFMWINHMYENVKSLQ